MDYDHLCTKMPTKLYAFGSNGSRQLGVGHGKDLAIPTESRFYSRATTSAIRRITAGGNHTLILLDDGSVWAAGERVDGRCGESMTKSPQSVENVNNYAGYFLPAKGGSFKLCAATWESSAFVSSDDRVYTCGSGSKGELGLGEHRSIALSPTLIRDFPPKNLSIVDIAASVSHTVVVLSNGDVYGWGNGRKGQLGEPAGIAWRPKKIESVGFAVVRAVCGKDFTYVVGDPTKGDHVVLGSDKHGVRSTARASVRDWKDVGSSWGGICVLFTDGSMVSGEETIMDKRGRTTFRS